MSEEYREQTVQGSLARKRAIKAREFVAAFREHTDDFYLLLRFSITRRQPPLPSVKGSSVSRHHGRSYHRFKAAQAQVEFLLFHTKTTT